MMSLRLMFIVMLALCASAIFADVNTVEYMGDLTDRILNASQGWGQLGIDVAAHDTGKAGEPLVIAGKKYEKGLGHHANGEIVIVLDGEYAAFDAEVGLQTQQYEQGSVNFQVIVDGCKKYDSGVMKNGDPAKAVHVSLNGAQDLRLVVKDAGDGVICDMADWAEARLTWRSGHKLADAGQTVDMARFARVVTWDPQRMDGCRSDRVHEFSADDVFLDKDIAANSDGTYIVPVSNDGSGCIGLQWLNRRNLREVGIQFADALLVPAPESVNVQYWTGESAWQGKWEPLNTKVEQQGDRLVARVAMKNANGNLMLTQKIRWFFSKLSKPVTIKNISALTRSRWNTIRLLVQADKSMAGKIGEIAIYNGEFVNGARRFWDMSEPLHVDMRYSCPTSFRPDRTVIEFKVPGGAFGVGVDDVISNGCVYVNNFGLFVAAEPLKMSLEGYKKRISSHKTVLEQVRAMPDQTFERAMAKTHMDVQKNGPLMLSLACDNTKFVVTRDGMLQFLAFPELTNGWFTETDAVRPSFGRGETKDIERHLDNGWLPESVITVKKDGITYTERAFVAPYDDDGEDPARINRRSVCVVEITAANTDAVAKDAAIQLDFLTNEKKKVAAQLTKTSRGYLMNDQQRPVALLDTAGCGNLAVQSEGGTVHITGSLAANGTAKCVLYVPGAGVGSDEVASLNGADSLKSKVEPYWNTVMACAARIETPDALLNDVIKSSQVRCLINSRNEGNGARIAPWISSMSYGPLESESNSIIRGMDLLGYDEFAQKSLDFFVNKYNAEGYLTTGYTMFGTAWHLWTLGEHYQLNADSDWMKRVAPEVSRVCNWIIGQTEKTKGLDAHARKLPEYGLMPPGVLADWNAFAYHFSMNAYYYAALDRVGQALKGISDPNAVLFEKKADDLKSEILRAYSWTQSKTPVLELGNGAWIPSYPSQVHSPGPLMDFFPDQDSGRSWCYDVELGAHQLVAAGVLDAGSAEVTRMMDHMEDVQFLSDGWFDYPAAGNHSDWFDMGGFSKVQPYYTRAGEIYAMRDEVKPFIRSYFNALSSLLNPETLTLWEHFHNMGAPDKTHETGYFLQQSRFMMAMEHGNELWLAPLITNNWLRDGQSVSANGLPTLFGKTGFMIVSHASSGYIDALINPPTRKLPDVIVIRLRHPDGKKIKSVLINGVKHDDFDPDEDIIRIQPTTSAISVRAQY